MAKKDDPGWQQVTDARVRVADMLDPLTAEQAEADSLCDGWIVHHVTAHIAGFCEFKLLQFFGGAIRAGFNFDKLSDTSARDGAQRPMAELAGVIRDRADATPPLPMFDPEMVLTDVIIHAQDIAVPLGIDHPIPDADALAVLGFVTMHKSAKTMLDPAHFAGLTLTATDLDWTWGEGPEVRGPARDLLLAMAGRRAAETLSGDGVAQLA